MAPVHLLAPCQHPPVGQLDLDVPGVGAWEGALVVGRHADPAGEVEDLGVVQRLVLQLGEPEPAAPAMFPNWDGAVDVRTDPARRERDRAVLRKMLQR